MALKNKDRNLESGSIVGLEPQINMLRWLTGLTVLAHVASQFSGPFTRQG